LTRRYNLKKLKEQNRADDYLKINVFMNSNISINKLEEAMKEIKKNKHFLNKKNEITEECADYLELYYGA
jgi:plasmid maintenance system antidote protein VapI